VACVTRKHHFEPVVNQHRKTMEGLPAAEKDRGEVAIGEKYEPKP
jgi:hypothetical protein